MKLGVSITAFREKDIVPIIRQYEGIADKIVVTASKTSWYGDMKNDDTAERAVRETSAIVCQDNWIEHDQRNFSMNLLSDMDYVLVSHCDTWFTKTDLLKLKSMTLTDLHYGCKVYMYWKDYESVVYPYIGLPTILVRSDARFTHIINIEDQLADPKELPITCYHTSWVKTDEEVQKKLKTYSHAGEIQSDWYERVWKGWKEGMTDFAPTTPHDYKSIVKHPMPQEIIRRING